MGHLIAKLYIFSIHSTRPLLTILHHLCITCHEVLPNGIHHNTTPYFLSPLARAVHMHLSSPLPSPPLLSPLLPRVAFVAEWFSITLIGVSALKASTSRGKRGRQGPLLRLWIDRKSTR